MSEKHLHEVVDEIKYLIDQGKAKDALPLTHLLLSHYPRYIQGYQLLAEIALEEGYSADAIEVLQRILSADPESFVAHAGLAVAFKNKEQAEDALWHIQRAFEMEPRLREVREEVRQISKLHTGHRPGRLRLNGAALSRMYMREGTYDQAVKQLKGELETQQNRVDLQVALAEAEWFAQRHSDAVRTSRQVLQDLPLCLKINLILGQFYAQQEDFGQAERFLHVVQQLDPANELSAAWFGKAGYLQAREIIIPLNDEGSQNENKTKMPRWLTNLSLFAAYDTEEQQESPAVTSIDDSFEFDLESSVVDANPIDEADDTPVISIDRDFDFDVSAEPATDSTKTLEPESASDLIEPHFIEEPLDPPPSALRPSSPPLSPPSISAQAPWRDTLRAKTEAALIEHQSSDDFSRSSPSETTEAWPEHSRRAVTTKQKEYLMPSQAEWKERLASATHAALAKVDAEQEPTAQPIPQPVDISDQVIEWKEKLSAATHAALVERETKQLMEVAEPTLVPFVDAAKIDWRHGLIAATHAALADYEAAQSEDVTPVDSVDTFDWRQQLASATHAALAEHEAAQSEDVTPVDSVGTLEWRQQLRSATDAALAEHEALPGADIAALAESAEETTPSMVDQSAHAAWKDALKVETEAHLASQKEVKTAIDEVPTPLTIPAEEAQPAPKARRRLGKRWIEGLRFDTEVWLTTMRREQRESELELEKAVVAVEAKEAEEAELTTLPSQIEPEEAVRSWLTSLRLQTEEELAAKPTWIAQLDQTSQAELAALSTAPAWVAGLRAETNQELAESTSEAQETTEVVTTQEVDEDREETSEVVTTQEVDEDREETSEVVTTQEVEEETSEAVTTQEVEEASSVESSDDFSRSELPKTSEVVTTQEVEEETTEAVTTDDVEEETTEAVTTDDVDEDTEETTEAVTTDDVEEETTEAVTTDDVDEDTEETTEAVTTDDVDEDTEETTEAVTTDDVDEDTEETTEVVTTSEVEESSELLSPSYTNGTVTSEPIVPDRWQVARQAWQMGKTEEAYAIYQGFFSESDEYDAQLDDALSAWTRIDDAPFLAFQLLGDVYRRMRRMQDAVKQYREAIKRI